MLLKFLKKLKRWILTKQFLFEEEITPVTKAQSTQENTRDAQTRKRVAQAFKAQEKQMQARAMRPHSPDCKDLLTCKKRICFTWEPDKIVEKKHED